MDCTKLVKDAARYRVKRANAANRGGGSCERWDSWTPLDELRRFGLDLLMTDTTWKVVRFSGRGNLDAARGEVVAEFPRKYSQRKTCLCYTDLMPDVPRIII